MCEQDEQGEQYELTEQYGALKITGQTEITVHI